MYGVIPWGSNGHKASSLGYVDQDSWPEVLGVVVLLCRYEFVVVPGFELRVRLLGAGELMHRCKLSPMVPWCDKYRREAIASKLEEFMASNPWLAVTDSSSDDWYE